MSSQLPGICVCDVSLSPVIKEVRLGTAEIRQSFVWWQVCSHQGATATTVIAAHCRLVLIDAVAACLLMASQRSNSTFEVITCQGSQPRCLYAYIHSRLRLFFPHMLIITFHSDALL